MIFKGKVDRRSSAGKQPHVAGEAEVFARSPKRKPRIMKETSWGDVFEGTLNLKVDKWVHAGLRGMCPLFFEHSKDIKHPDPRIPERRCGYYYYRATASAGGKTEAVLVRRAHSPHSERSVELLAQVKLMELLQIDQDSEVEVTVE